MVANTLLLTTVIMLGLAFLLMGECQFLIPVSPSSLREIRRRYRAFCSGSFRECVRGGLWNWPKTLPQRHRPQTRPFREAAAHGSQYFGRALATTSGITMDRSIGTDP